MTRSVPLELTHLPWQDVIFKYILPCLSVKDLCPLRRTSKMFLHMFNDYMASCKRLDFTGFRVSECKGLTGAAFQILVVKCKKLNTILVGDCPWFSCGCWQVLILHQTKLQCINFSGCWNIDLSETLEQFF
ncbi:hypothetical protein Pmani_008724 [Petrolisthes manimaculis]|uniref:F-box domain-containing protein n=1 Tax=Petrolisthes manimaculis TaxID=1843537 RepID=A0AAE1Q533_9EUCA|nr:hypothetical protein Pmani_008724 [Petrolisthes manimaculis]